jgi:NitT/TauT family transport system permease protein
VTVLAAPSSWRRGPHLRSLSALVVAVALAAVAWQLATVLSDGWVPSLDRIGVALVENITDPAIWGEMAITARRILIGFVAATVIGVALGFAMGLDRRVEAFFRPLVVIGLAIPDPVYIIVAILVLGTDESSGLTALIIALIPFIVVIVHGAVRARETQLDEMSQVYRLGRRRYLTEVLARQIAPGLLVAARTSFAFAWKIVVLVEALSQPQGIGSQMYYAFRLLRPADMIALALIFIVLMRIVETLAFGFAERRLLAWRN